MEGVLVIAHLLEERLNEAYSTGNHSDFSFREIIAIGDKRLIPFKHLLSVINSTHTEGYAEAN